LREEKPSVKIIVFR